MFCEHRITIKIKAEKTLITSDVEFFLIQFINRQVLVWRSWVREARLMVNQNCKLVYE